MILCVRTIYIKQPTIFWLQQGAEPAQNMCIIITTHAPEKKTVCMYGVYITCCLPSHSSTDSFRSTHAPTHPPTHLTGDMIAYTTKK